MAFGTFVIYATDNTTPMAIPQPTRATWTREQVGTFLDGAPRLAPRAVVEWQFAHLTRAQYEALGAAIIGRKHPQLATYRAGEVVPPVMQKCWATPFPVVQGEESHGAYVGVAVKFIEVSPV